MANKQKKEDAVSIRKVEPVLPQTKATPPENVPNGGGAEPQPAPYSEFGGLTQVLQKRSEDAAQRRVEAQNEWERRLGEQSSARQALVGAAAPKDTSREQRKLRNLAIGQAAGEFFSALFGGIYGLSSKGRGYVPKMPGLYRNTLARVQQLKDNDIAADQRFRGLIGSMMDQDARDRVTIAREQYRDATAEEKQLRTTKDLADMEAYRAENRRGLSEIQAEHRRILQEDRHEQRLGEQRNAAALKGKVGSGVEASGDVAYVTKLLLPETRTSKTTGGKFPLTTVRDVSSYNKQEVAAASALAQQIVPIRVRYKLSDYDIQTLHRAIAVRASQGITWAHIEDALKKGLSPQDIIDSLQ